MKMTLRAGANFEVWLWATLPNIIFTEILNPKLFPLQKCAINRSNRASIVNTDTSTRLNGTFSLP
jgi:hypothetical protein